MAHDTVTLDNRGASESKAAPETTTVAPKAPPKARLKAPLDKRGPVLALAFIGAFVLITIASDPASKEAVLPWTLNPTGYLTFWSFAILYIITLPAKHIMDAGLDYLAETVFGFQRLDEGDTHGKLEVLEAVDLTYLALNTMVEFIGMNHIASVILGQHITYPLSEFTVWNGPVAFFVVMSVNDVIYYPFHWFFHKPIAYPYVHKQHHRQFMPFRGYADAANQHPVEQSYGFSIFIVAMRITSATVGVSASAVWCCFLSWALFNVANHMAFDSLLHLPLLYPAFPRDHQMHHRFPRCNYSTLSTFMDRYFGSFVSYKAIGGSTACFAKQERPEAMPSPWSVVSLAVGLVVAGVVAELVRTGSFLPSQASVFLPTLTFLAVAAAACSASVVWGKASSPKVCSARVKVESDQPTSTPTPEFAASLIKLGTSQKQE